MVDAGLPNGPWIALPLSTMLFNMLKQKAQLCCDVSKIDKLIGIQQHTLDLLVVIFTVCEARSSAFLVTPFPTERMNNVQKWWEHGEAC